MSVSAKAVGTPRPRLFRTVSWISAWEEVWPFAGPGTSAPGNSSGFVSFPIGLGRFIQFQSIAPRGTFTSDLNSFATEYLCFDTQQAFSAFLNSIVHERWDQLYLRGLLDQGFECDLLKQYCRERGYQLMRREDTPAYGVSTEGASFEAYCAALGKSTRDRVLGGRKRLERQGDLQVLNMWPDIDGFLKVLNQFHVVRWDKPCFTGQKERFAKSFLSNIVREGGVVDLSVVRLGGNCLSAMLDVELDGWVYNLQSGFSDENFGRVSLGMVHIGLNLEKAFNDPKVRYYDFLAGSGKINNYKASISNSVVAMGDYYVVRSPMLQRFYRWNDWLKNNRTVKRYP